MSRLNLQARVVTSVEFALTKHNVALLLQLLLVHIQATISGCFRQAEYLSATTFIMVNITYVDLLQLATSYNYADQLQTITNASVDHVSLLAYDQSFVDDVLGTNVTQRLVADLPWEAFHEAGVYNKGRVLHHHTRLTCSDFLMQQQTRSTRPATGPAVLTTPST